MDTPFDPRHTAEENENFQLAHKYMNMYAESLVDEYKVKKENAFLFKSLERITDELKDIKGELAEVKEQNNTIAEGFRYLELTKLTIGLSGGGRGYRGDVADFGDVLNRLPNGRSKGYGSEPLSEESPLPNERTVRYRTDGLRKRQLNVEALSQDEQFREMFGRPQQMQESPPQTHPPDTPQTPQPQTDEPPTQLRAAVDVGEHPPEIPGRTEEARVPETAPTIPEPAPSAQPPQVSQTPTKKNKMLGTVSNILFYLCMVLLVLGAVTFSQSDNANKSILGFRYYYIKSASMVPVFPVGSMVITKVVDPQEIKVGDDITVYVGDESSETYLTHRVVEITTDSAGEQAFRTRGVNNKSNDPAPFNAKLMVGKVVLCIPGLGMVMTFVRSQLWLVIGIFILLLALSFMLRLLFSKETPTGEPGASNEPRKPKQPKTPKPPKSGGKFMRKTRQTVTQ